MTNKAEDFANMQPEADRKAPTFNTRRIQMFELGVFMLESYGALFDGVCYTNSNNNQQWSFKSAVELFNSRELDEDDQYICKKVNLTYAKKRRAVLCTNPLIKLTDAFKQSVSEEYQDTFEVPEGLDDYVLQPEPIDVVKALLKRLRLR
ncbi:hypothetical protein [Pectobacterium phage Wc4-1]|uniref:Uncharacterized protein n=1 Tax=Pectobacterium phage Wc4 TaxID=2652428 RepID=A0A5P8D584_9CAUD|nr:hypothetical protein [Pectobacterium phage Wc4]QFP93956.1 hypothetical protein [Pectobacterium phage Wc4-1]